MKTKKQHVIFLESISGVLLVIFIGLGLMVRGYKEKSEFEKFTGKINYLEQTFQDLPVRHAGKYRYLSIENYPAKFELFIGKDITDFKPALERIDELHPGDEIEIYFDFEEHTNDETVNRLVQYIDKSDVPYFIRGNNNRYSGFFLIVAGLMLGGIILHLKRKGRIA